MTQNAEHFFPTPELPKVKGADIITEDNWKKLMLDSMPIGFLLRDSDFNVVACNPEFLYLFGFDTVEDYQANYREILFEYLPDGRLTSDAFAQTMETAYKTGRANLEWPLKTQDGTVRYVESIFVIVEWEGKDCLAIFVRDLTDQHMYREAERTAQQRMQVVLDASPILCAIFDENYNVIEVNQAANKLFGPSGQQAYKERFFDLSPKFQPDGTLSSDIFYQHMKQVFETGHGNWEILHIALDGTLIPCEVSLVRVSLSGQDVAIAYVRDLREQKEMLEQIEYAHSQEQLANQAKANLEAVTESNMAKSRFLARMSHEIRTPISAVMGISQIQLQDKNLPPQTEEAFVMINNSAHLLLGIVNDILDISKIEAAKMVIQQTEYQVASMIYNVACLQFTQIESKNIKFNLYVDENLPTVLIGDSLRIEQIMNNILSNSLKYTESGQIELHVRCEKNQEFDNMLELIISISDTGFGMTKEQVDILKNDKEYVRFHEQDKSNIGGTGLGMPIVTSLVRMMDARIDIDSEVGKGTTVTICIPQQVAKNKVLGKHLAGQLQKFEADVQSVANKFKFAPEPMPYGSVLIVDDIEINRHVAQGLLEFYDLRIETCNSGFDAIRKVEAGNVYDIIFMDHMMPELDGIEATRMIRDTGYTKPIVALTANAMIGQAEDFINNGFDGFISKPIQTTQLNNILVKYIRSNYLPEAIESSTTTDEPNAGDYLKSTALIKKVKVDFAKKHKNDFADICTALDKGDMEAAVILAHTIKGLAGLIRESALAEAAENVEKVLDKGKVPTYTMLFTLEREFEAVLKGIEIPQTPVAATVIQPGNNYNALFDKLEQLLNMHSVNCLNYLDELRTIPEAAVLIQQIEDFDFEAAAGTLRELRTAL